MGFIAQSDPGGSLDTTRSRSDALKGVMSLNIEPMISERTRMAGMTAEDRRLRQQWCEDQWLTEREPVRVTALVYRNNFKRLFGYPMDFTFKKLIMHKVLHPRVAVVSRWLLGKMGLLTLGIGIVAYHFRHNQANWERCTGLVHRKWREPILPGDEGWDDPDAGKTDPWMWATNRYFHDRTVFLNPKTMKTSSETATEISRRNAGLL